MPVNRDLGARIVQGTQSVFGYASDATLSSGGLQLVGGWHRRFYGRFDDWSLRSRRGPARSRRLRRGGEFSIAGH